MMLLPVTCTKQDAEPGHLRGIEGLDWDVNENLFIDSMELRRPEGRRFWLKRLRQNLRSGSRLFQLYGDLVVGQSGIQSKEIVKLVSVKAKVLRKRALSC